MRAEVELCKLLQFDPGVIGKSRLVVGQLDPSAWGAEVGMPSGTTVRR
jgi:hypothetical protein